MKTQYLSMEEKAKLLEWCESNHFQVSSHAAHLLFKELDRLEFIIRNMEAKAESFIDYFHISDERQNPTEIS